MRIFVGSILILLLVTNWACSSENTFTEHSSVSYLYPPDSTIDPADNFFRFANGKWLMDIASTGSGEVGNIDLLTDSVNSTLLLLLTSEEVPGKMVLSDEEKAIAFYTIGMDSLAVEEFGVSPLQSLFTQIDSLRSMADIMEYLAIATRYDIPSIFDLSVDPMGDPDPVMELRLSHGGISMKAEYYKEASNDSSAFGHYMRYIQEMFAMAGISGKAADIWLVESWLAAMITERHPDSLFIRTETANLEEYRTPWVEFFNELQVSDPGHIWIPDTHFLTEMDSLLINISFPVLKSYLKWQLLNSCAPYLGQELVKRHGEFYRLPPKPRWMRVLTTIDEYLGEALGKMYVEQAFSPMDREIARDMARNIQLSFASLIKKNNWLSDSTRKLMLDRLQTLEIQVGYPSVWTDHSGFILDRGPRMGSYVQNVLNGRRFRSERQLSSLGEKPERDNWVISPQTTEIVLDTVRNELLIPAAIAQKPLFDPDRDPSLNYGTLGVMISAKLSEYLYKGTWPRYLNEREKEIYDSLNKVLTGQYFLYDTLLQPGSLMIDRAAGDLLALELAYVSLERFSRSGTERDVINDNSFLLSWGALYRQWRENGKAGIEEARTNVPLMNFDRFHETIAPIPGDRMYLADSLRVSVW